MSTAEFQSQVWDYYLKKLNAGELNFAIPHPTPGKIRAACQKAIEVRFEKRDERMLRDYFEPNANQDLEVAIHKFDRDRFRPLSAFLLDPTINTNFDHIQLLAWLIDYPSRPYRSSYEISQLISEFPVQPEPAPTAGNHLEKNPDLGRSTAVTTIDSEIMVTPAPDQPTAEPAPETELIAPDSNLEPKFSWLRSGIWGLIIAVLFGIGFIICSHMAEQWRQQHESAIRITGKSGCVVWEDDRYIPIACNQAIKIVPNLSVDMNTVDDLRKIILPDTITPRSIGRIFYAKIDGHLEYFTTKGMHPIHTDLRLLPLTDYIYIKYLGRYKGLSK